jgi:CHASE3 domain sensor protein
MTLSMSKKIFVGFGLALLILLAIGVVWRQSTVRRVEIGSSVLRTHETPLELEGLSRSIEQFETTQSAYLMTGEVRYLDSSHLATASIDRSIGELRTFIADSPDQQRSLAHLLALINVRRGEIEESIGLRKQHGFEARPSATMPSAGSTTASAIDDLVAEMKNVEQNLRKELIAEENSNAQVTTYLTAGAFAQADASDTRQKGGTGLGLSITKAIVEKHGGRIDYEPRVGGGTSFFLDLPEWRLAADASLPRW